MAKKRTRRPKAGKPEEKKVKASFHLPTETNPDPSTGAREALDNEIDFAMRQIEDEWGGSSFEGFYVPGTGSYKMRQGPLAGETLIDIYRRFFVTFNKKGSKKEIAKLAAILEAFRKSTDKNGKYPIQESIYLEVQEVAVRFVAEQ
jgi:hypothetical protein